MPSSVEPDVPRLYPERIATNESLTTWLITVDKGPIFLSNETMDSAQLALAVIGEIVAETVPLRGTATWTPTYMVRVSQVMFMDRTLVSYNPPRRVVIDPNKVVSMVELYVSDPPSKVDP